MTLTEFANFIGVSKMTVSRACKPGGRIASFVVRDADGRAASINDPELAKQAWVANSDYTDAPQRAPQLAPTPARAPTPTEDEPPNLHEASAREKHWKAELAELKFKEAAGELVPAAEVRSKVEGAFRTCKTKLLAIPSRARQAIPHLTIAETASLEDLIREALEELASVE